MKIKYNGPGAFVMVEPHGMHKKGEVKEYPDDFGANLIETSRKQKFEVVDASDKKGKKGAAE